MSDIPNLPSEFNYSRKKSTTMPTIQPFYKRYNADVTSVLPSGEFKFSIPPAQFTHFLPTDSYVGGILNFTVDNGGIVSVDGSAFSLFEKGRVTQGGILLDEISVGYGKLLHVINDCTRNYTDRQNDSIHLLAQSTAVLGTNASLGAYLTSLNGVNGTNATYALPFAFVIPSSLLGSMADYATPLGWMSAGNIELTFTLASQNNMFANYTAGGTITAVSISDMYFHSKEVKLPANIDQALMRSSMQPDGTIQIPAYQWRTFYKPSIPASVTSFEERFPITFSSVNFILWWCHNSAAQNSQTYRSQTSRPHHSINAWQFSINGELHPPIPIDNRSRNIMELARCYDFLSLSRGVGILDGTTYMNSADDNLVASDANTANITHKRTVRGFSLSKTNASGETAFDGLSLAGSQFSIRCTDKTAVNQVFDLYCAAYIDVIYVIRDGAINVVV